MGHKIFTLDDLSNRLSAELAWRKKELTVIKSKIPIEKNSLQSAMIRASLPLLYAHWEGFIKLTMGHYLEFVANKYLKHNELKTSFIALSLQNKLGDLNTGSFENKIRIVQFLFDNIDSRSNIPKKNIINTKSNLRFDVLREILTILDLNDSHIDSQKDLIDDLVDQRNYIAHGEHRLIDYKTFESFYTDILSLMEYLKTTLENNALLNMYRAPTLS